MRMTCNNPCHPIGLFLYPLSKYENLWFSDIFKGYNRTLAWNWSTIWSNLKPASVQNLKKTFEKKKILSFCRTKWWLKERRLIHFLDFWKLVIEKVVNEVKGQDKLVFWKYGTIYSTDGIINQWKDQNLHQARATPNTNTCAKSYTNWASTF